MEASHSAHNMVDFLTSSLIIFAVIQLQNSKTKQSKSIKNKNQNEKNLDIKCWPAILFTIWLIFKLPV